MSDIRRFMNIVEGAKPAKTEIEWGGLRSLLNLKEDAASMSTRDSGAEPGLSPGLPLHDHAPALGMEFTYRDRTYVVMGYMREERPAGEPRAFGKRNASRPPLKACHPHGATWVHGMGGGGQGCVAPISDVQPTGRNANWSPEQRQRAQHAAGELVAQGYTVAQPDRGPLPRPTM